MQYLIILANLEYVGHAVVLDDCSIDILIRYILIRYCNKIRSSPVNNRLARPNTHYLIDQISQDIIVIKALIGCSELEVVNGDFEAGRRVKYSM